MSLADLGMALLNVVLAVIVLGLVSLSERRLGSNQNTMQTRSLIYALVMGAWLMVTALLAIRGMIGAKEVPFVLLPSALGVLIYEISPAATRLARGLKFQELIALQFFRLPVELILLLYFYENRVPVSMTFEGRNYDVLTALSALLVAPLVASQKLGRKAIGVWNCFGLALLVNVVSIAVRSVQPQEGEGVNTLPFSWPSIWILFCVMVALASHLLIFLKLRRHLDGPSAG